MIFRFLIVLFIACMFFITGTQVSAHLPGQPPYFKINGVYSDLYLMQSVFPDIELPQDISKDTYLVNEPIDFEIDIEKLKEVVPEEIIKKTTFAWEFGDGSKGEGVSNTHTYTKMGTYVLEIFVQYTEEGHTIPPTLIQSALFHVLPDASYTLPKAVIKVNGMEENKDPRNNVFRLNLEDEITFDAFFSQAPSSKIVSYLWGFGDGQTSTKATSKHRFSVGNEFVSPGLRVTDANGFYADYNVGISHDPKAPVVSPTNFLNTNDGLLLLKIAVPLIALFGLLFFWITKSARRSE